MGTLRLQPARLAGLSPRAVSRAWTVFDIQLAVYATALVVIGLLMAFTNSGDDPLEAGSLFTRGLMWLAIAIMVFTVAAAFDYRWARTFVWLVYLIDIGFLVMTLAIGTGVGGTSRWVTLGPLQFQFSEMAKVLTALTIAAWLAHRQTRIDGFGTILGAAVIVAPPLGLVLIQPDLGTSLVLGAILFGALFMSGASLRWLAAGIVMVLAAFPVVWTSVLKDYQKERLISFLDPAADAQGAGYQLIQSQAAVSSGGLFGRGLTNGQQGAAYLPVQSTDFVFSRVGEELGFLGGALVLVLFALLLWRVLTIGWRCRDPFGLAFAGGVAGMLLFQLLVNVGMVLGVMPITGIPLPFITHGGASLISTALALGLLESIAMRQGKPSG
ncbi:MAG: rod shape-determining protein RodA [Chloroflexi bacterium]|nr:rod shape-determining protein RodA [Chloroflexota bacterium]